MKDFQKGFSSSGAATPIKKNWGCFLYSPKITNNLETETVSSNRAKSPVRANNRYFINQSRWNGRKNNPRPFFRREFRPRQWFRQGNRFGNSRPNNQITPRSGGAQPVVVKVINTNAEAARQQAHPPFFAHNNFQPPFPAFCFPTQQRPQIHRRVFWNRQNHYNRQPSGFRRRQFIRRGYGGRAQGGDQRRS